MRRIEPNWRENRHHLAKEIILDPSLLLRIPVRAAEESDTLGCQRRKNVVVQQRVLARHDPVRLRSNKLECLFGCFPVEATTPGVKLDLLLQACHADLEKLIHVGRNDGEKLEAL